MKSISIYYSSAFASLFQKLPHHIQQRALKTEALFRQNPLHPSLRLHKLQGRLKDLWNISITKQYRIIFYITADGHSVFCSVGTHEIYE